MVVCERDIIHWVNRWVWTEDPRAKSSLMPFDLWPKQREFLLWLEDRERDGEDGVAEKSRDVGFTWLCITFAVHRWLFKTGSNIGFGSRKLDLVDKVGDADTILEKGRILMRNLPHWMHPRKFATGYCKFVNWDRRSTITGEGGDQIGRGGRKSAYFLDEAAFVEHPDLIDRSLSATTNVRIDVSTPNGPGNSFARKRFSGTFKVFSFHWSDDPRKSTEWAARKRESIGEVAWAQEFDLDYNASIEGICIPSAWVRSAVNLDLSNLVNGDEQVIGGFDPADGGADKSVLIARRGPIVLPPKEWSQQSAGRAAHLAGTEAEAIGASTVFYDSIGIGTSVSEAWTNAEVAPRFSPVGVNWGDAPTRTLWPSGKRSNDMFSNLRMELWWTMRSRFEKTYQYVNEGAHFPADELISIPNCPELIADLGIPLVNITNTGKMQLESKADMRRRGVKSPNYGDALAYTFRPVYNNRSPSAMGVGRGYA